MRHILFLFLLATPLMILDCSRIPDTGYRQLPISGLPGSADLAATGNLAGGSKDELILSRDSQLWILDASKDSAVVLYEAHYSDDILKLAVGDVDSDPARELLIITGRQRYVETDVVVYLVQLVDGQWEGEELFRKHSIRPQPTDLIIADYDNDGNNEVIASYFESKYYVETAVLKYQAGDWMVEVLPPERMAMTRDIGQIGTRKENRMVVGRVYGDELGLLGDAYLLAPERVELPAFRGVKKVVVGDATGRGEQDIYLADGWHFDYGKIARGRLARVYETAGTFSYELIEDVKYQYEISQIKLADVDGDGKQEILTRGNRFFSIYQFNQDHWEVFRDTTITPAYFTIGNITGNRRQEVIFTGDSLRILQFGELTYSADLGKEVLTEPVNPDSLVGTQAPELSIVQWFNGSFNGISNSRGKVILLDFWATWCKPCIKTFPAMRRFQETYGPEGFQILGLTRIDNRQTREEIEFFIDTASFTYPIGLSDESFNNLAYGVGAIPHVVLIDRKGIIRYYHVGSGNEEALENRIRECLKE